MSWILKHLNKIPQPYRLIVFVIAVVGLMLTFFALFSQVRSCGYDKARTQYQQDRDKWLTERAELIGRAEEKEKRIAELEPKAIAFDALAEQNKKIDAGLAQQIEEVSKDAANQEALAEQPTDCRTRAARVCELLRANHIKHDCERITKESCGPR